MVVALLGQFGSGMVGFDRRCWGFGFIFGFGLVGLAMKLTSDMRHYLQMSKLHSQNEYAKGPVGLYKD